MTAGRRLLATFEVTLGAAGCALGVFLLVFGCANGRHDVHHGGAYAMIGGAAMIAAGLSLLGPGLLLSKWRGLAAWVPQLIPASVVTWIAWDVMRRWLDR